ncbi:MAG: type II toxin-antitoxin system Phd/YefM family antitoxin [Candidatus Sericytochromatia bacterium]|nr:type II toxin-antitoxin system Phd/YefM family antitoxin [Candidatus Tanganyikabacteria bacterium]
MEPVRISADFMTVAGCKAHLSQVIRDLGERRRRQVVVTHQGKPAAVIISAEDFDRIQERERFLTAVARGMADLTAGRVVPHDQVVAEFERRWQDDRQG